MLRGPPALPRGLPAADRCRLFYVTLHCTRHPPGVCASDAALGEIDRLLGKDVAKGKLTEAAAREARARIAPLADLRDLKALERDEAVELIMEVGLFRSQSDSWKSGTSTWSLRQKMSFLEAGGLRRPAGM